MRQRSLTLSQLLFARQWEGLRRVYFRARKDTLNEQIAAQLEQNYQDRINAFDYITDPER